MPAPPPAVEEGQFDDAPIDRPPRQEYNTSSDRSEDSSEDDDDFDDSEEPDDDLTRVEDEDWETVEKGEC
jgi:hypothetical protein